MWVNICFKKENEDTLHISLNDCTVTLTQELDELPPTEDGWKQVKSSGTVEIIIRGTRPGLAHKKEQNLNQTQRNQNG